MDEDGIIEVKEMIKYDSIIGYDIITIFQFQSNADNNSNAIYLVPNCKHVSYLKTSTA